MGEDHYTLLGVRPDGVAPVVDLVIADTRTAALERAHAFLAEHGSCDRVEVWKGGLLVREIQRGGAAPA